MSIIIYIRSIGRLFGLFDHCLWKANISKQVSFLRFPDCYVNAVGSGFSRQNVTRAPQLPRVSRLVTSDQWPDIGGVGAPTVGHQSLIPPTIYGEGGGGC